MIYHYSQSRNCVYPKIVSAPRFFKNIRLIKLCGSERLNCIRLLTTSRWLQYDKFFEKLDYKWNRPLSLRQLAIAVNLSHGNAC